jgi:hypothetical protein
MCTYLFQKVISLLLTLRKNLPNADFRGYTIDTYVTYFYKYHIATNVVRFAVLTI